MVSILMLQKRRKAYGVTLGLLSSAAFGMIPLFSLPLFHNGFTVQSALFYRFSIAALVIWLILLGLREKILLPIIDICKLSFLSLLYMMAVVVFFHSFSFLPSGVVATIQFLYPVMVMLIMIFFFHEKFYWRVTWAVLLAVLGVGLLSTGPGLETPNVSGPNGMSSVVWGVCLSLLSGLCNGLYIVGIQVIRLPRINGLVMTFYVMLFGALFSLVNALFMDSLHGISSLPELGLILLLALVTAVFSNLTLIMAIKEIGSTLTSILGVMEPLTAVVIGILVFHEPLTWHLVIGVFFIASSVLLAIIGPNPDKSK